MHMVENYVTVTNKYFYLPLQLVIKSLSGKMSDLKPWLAYLGMVTTPLLSPTHPPWHETTHVFQIITLIIIRATL